MSISEPDEEIIEEEINDFPQFDHHFRYLNFYPINPKWVHSKIMEEWRILRESLPPTIFVRVNRRRIDLMTAAIIGAAGTPYHDGLYFFDIAFPEDYPFQPPLVHYRSYGSSINPNLNSDGHVCLSLLNTAPFGVRERWKPLKSSVLQVLVSLQALVSNDKPYYDEPLLILTGEKYSDSYSEDVFVKSCLTMLHTLRKPPQNFENLVMKHFSERGRKILEACVAYAQNTVKVGYYGCDRSFKSNVSRKFQMKMMRLVPEMVNAFARNGGRKNELESIVEQMIKTMSCEKTNYDQIVLRFLEMVKKCWD